MKYTIYGFSQRKAIEYDLTSDDLLVLRWIIDFSNTNKMKTIYEDNKVYYWINYATILEELPILNISKDRLKRKIFNKLCEANVLIHKHIKIGGSFSYYAIGDNYLSLISDSEEKTNDTTNLTNGYVKNNVGGTADLTYGYDKNNDTKINLLNNSSTNNSSTKENNHQQVDGVSSGSTEEEILKKEFEELWEQYPRKEGKSVAFKSYCKYRKSTKADYITEEDVEKGIEAYNRHIKANNIETKYIKQGSTYFNQRCWEDVYPETKAFEDAPEWFYKDIELDEASEEVSQEIKDLLSAIR